MDARDELPFATLLWQPRRETWLLTVVCKATFKLAPGELELSSRHLPVTQEDSYWDDDDSRSLAAASEMVPLKARTDVIVVGSAFALDGAPVRSLIARVAFGSLDKSIEISTDRSVGPDGTVYQGPRFARMPLVYERAAGGPGTRNPAGVRPGTRDSYGRTVFPNITAVGKGSETNAVIEPVGFAPIAPGWPDRQTHAGPFAALLTSGAWRDEPLPESIDHSYFNVAPPDQQLDAIATDGAIVLEGLSREHASLRAKLPGIVAAVTVERGGKNDRLQMRADTLAIDTDQATVTITWRGHVPLESARQPFRVVARAERSRASWQTALGPVTAVRIDPLAMEATAAGEVAPIPIPEPRARTFLDTSSAKAASAALPFQSAVRAPAPAIPVPPPSRHGAMPQVAPPEAWPIATPPPAPLAVPAPAPVIARPVGAVSASNAAADPAQRAQAAPARRIEGDVLDLLWCNVDAAARVRRKPAWLETLASLEAGRVDLDADGAPGAEDPDKVEARREINHVLSRATPSGDDGVERALQSAIRADGRFAPALILLLGELRFDFDEIEMLKATIACATPFAAGDEPLEKELEAAQQFLSTPGQVAAPEVTGSMTTRVRDAFHAQKRVVADNYLDDQTERVLLERRAFQMRAVFGAPHLRCLFHFAGSDVGIPTYLPEALKKKLPLFRRMRARMLAEAHFQADQYETHPAALKPVAVARIVR